MSATSAAGASVARRGSSPGAHVALALVQSVLGAGASLVLGLGLAPWAASFSLVFAIGALVSVVQAVLAVRRAETRLLRFGWPAPLWALAVVLTFALGPVAFALHDALPPEESALYVAGVFALTTGFASFAASALLARASRVAQGTPGTVRLVIGGTSTLVLVLAQIVFAGIVAAAAHTRVSFDLTFALDAPGASPIGLYLETLDTVAFSEGLVPFLYGSYVLAGVAALLQLGALIASWFLVPAAVRRGIFLVVDFLLLCGFVFALWALPFSPPEEHPDAVTLPAIALGITALFATRVILRFLPVVLDLIELLGFQTLVAARMLRAKKSGFLTIIGFLSILAVSFSSCTLATTLSVMGGFRADLQDKILGSHAHIVIDREYGTFSGWSAVLDQASEVEGVTGVTPYVSGEVMITSASSLAGAQLRGIDPATIGDATDLPLDMTHGRLEFLSEPERMLDLTPDEMNGDLLVPELAPRGDSHSLVLDDEASPPEIVDHDAGLAPPGVELPSPGAEGAIGREDRAPSRGTPRSDHASLMREIDEMLAEIDERQGGAPNMRQLDRAREDPSATARDRLAAEVDEFLLPEALSSRPSPEPARIDELFPRADVLPGLIVGRELARTLRLHVGDEVNVVSPNGDLGPTGPVPRTRPFRVAGIFYSGMYEYDMQMAYTDLATAQRFLRAGDQVSGVEIRVDDWERADVFARQVADRIDRDDLRVRSWQEVNQNLFGALQLEKLAMFITLGIAILVASFCVIGTLTLMVQEKGREVAILKAMGADDQTMVGMFLLQGLFIGLVGAFSGLGLGYVACFAAQHFGIRMNPEVYYIDELPVHIDPLEFLMVGVAAVLVCVLATIYPAILGSRLRPVDALRNL